MSSDIKVGLVTEEYPPDIGGVGNSVCRIAHMLTAAGVACEVVAFSSRDASVPLDESVATSEEDGVVVHRVAVLRRDPDDPRDPATLTQRNREMFQALDVLQRRQRYDILHGFYLVPAAYVATAVARQHNVASVASIRGSDVGKNAFDPILRPFVEWTLEHADYVTSVSTDLLELADRTVAPVAGKSCVILNSIDTTLLQAPSRPPLELPGIVIGSVGFFRWKKGLVYLFKALARLRDTAEFTLLLAGDFRPEHKEAHLAELERLGLRERTRITGRFARGGVTDHLQCMDIVVFPSLLGEGCPLALLEALAFGKPVVASRAGAIPEVLRDRHNGLLVEPGSTDDLARALCELVASPELRETLACTAREDAATLSPERELEGWHGVYAQVMASRGR